jgi:hypothetical protein
MVKNHKDTKFFIMVTQPDMILYHVRLNSYDKIKVGSSNIRFDIVSDLPDMILLAPTLFYHLTTAGNN